MAEFSFDKMLENDRLAEMLHREVLDGNDVDPALIERLQSYAEAYARYNQLNEEDVSQHYQLFASAFMRELKAFEKDAQYPVQRGETGHTVDRIRYDIALIFSTLFTRHRYRLMYLVNLHFPKHAHRAACIGCGPALELIFLKKRVDIMEGYDLSLNPFCRYAHPEVYFYEKPFTDEKSDTYDVLLAIELLEHLSDPYKLLHKAHTALKNGGYILLTTATDVPQFDHLYNFPADHSVFEKTCKEIGFELVYKECVSHRYLFSKVAASNHFYIFRKVIS